MRVASTETEATLLVKGGKLEEAYQLLARQKQKLFLHLLGAFKLRRTLSYLLPILLRRALDQPSNQFNPEDDAADLNLAFLLFWKRPNLVGMCLLIRLIQSKALNNEIPLRTCLWVAHWLVFQGNYNGAIQLFRRLRIYIPQNTRLRGELNSILGNYYYCRGKISTADQFHSRAQELFTFTDDKFMQVFNLGLWVRIAAKTLDQDKLVCILGKYDSLNPQSPDERYGLRILIYCAYVYNHTGQREIALRFQYAADRIYERSGSQLDRAVYKMVCAIMHGNAGNPTKAHEHLTAAIKHLKAYGKYDYYENLFNELLEIAKAGRDRSTHIANTETEQWYESFFSKTLPLFEKYSDSHLQDILEILRGQMCATSLQYSIVEAISELPKLEVVCRPAHSIITFDLRHSNRNYRISIESPFMPWRNPELFAAIRSTIVSLQALSFQEEAKKRFFEYEKAMELQRSAEQVAHDIKSPLAALDMIMKSTVLTESDERVIIQSAITRIRNITGNLLLKSRNATDNSTSTRLSASPQRLSKLIKTIITEKNIQTGSHTAIQIIFTDSTVLCDDVANVEPGEFGQVLSNLIDNAIESSENSGRIEVNLGNNATHVQITVKDNGKGIDLQTIPQLGLRGYTFGKIGGNGLGLHHAKKSLEAWAGTLTIESLLGAGTKITLQIPRVPPANHTEQQYN